MLRWFVVTFHVFCFSAAIFSLYVVCTNDEMHQASLLECRTTRLSTYMHVPLKPRCSRSQYTTAVPLGLNRLSPIRNPRYIVLERRESELTRRGKVMSWEGNQRREIERGIRKGEQRMGMENGNGEGKQRRRNTKGNQRWELKKGKQKRELEKNKEWKQREREKKEKKEQIKEFRGGNGKGRRGNSKGKIEQKNTCPFSFFTATNCSKYLFTESSSTCSSFAAISLRQLSSSVAFPRSMA